MHPNPFSPSFSIHPSLFFGRREYLRKFESALDTPGSADRFFFLTGTRGCGKTSLLHQYALQAAERRWEVIEATSSDALAQLLHFAGLDRRRTKTRSLSPAVSAAGAIDMTVGAASSTSEAAESPDLLTPELCKKLKAQKLKRGLALIVDEAQKIQRGDIVRIGNAVQQARTEGLEVALVLGGLPSAYSKIRSYRDCTFLRRMRREELWCMKKSETIETLRTMILKVPEIEVTDEQVFSIGQFTGGHPYLLQLVGDRLYALVEKTYAPEAGMKVAVADGLIEQAQLEALTPYKKNVLDDVLSGSHESTRSYIRAAFEARDETGLISVADVNARFPDGAAQMNSRRSYAINTQVLRPAGRGYLRFALPHFEYAYIETEHAAAPDADDEWEF